MPTSEQILEQIEYVLQKADYAINNKKCNNFDNVMYVQTQDYHGWASAAETLFKNAGIESYLTNYRKIQNDSHMSRNIAIEAGIGVINALKQDIKNGFVVLGQDQKLFKNADVLDSIFNNFHKSVRQIRYRHDNRSTLDVKDEYDVQDLLHALLKLFFDDIRAEEYTPSYAGSSARMDFLLKNEKVVIEVKKTRDTLKDKELGNQLIEDIARYKSHHDCKKLICFVYDPEGLISNPSGLSNDLSRFENDFEIQVVIKP